MHILAFILMFVVGSVGAAVNGDWSGMAAIGKFLVYILALAFVFFLLLHPVLACILGAASLVIVLFLIPQK